MVIRWTTSLIRKGRKDASSSLLEFRFCVAAFKSEDKIAFDFISNNSQDSKPDEIQKKTFEDQGIISLYPFQRKDKTMFDLIPRKLPHDNITKV